MWGDNIGCTGDTSLATDRWLHLLMGTVLFKEVCAAREEHYSFDLPSLLQDIVTCFGQVTTPIGPACPVDNASPI